MLLLYGSDAFIQPTSKSVVGDIFDDKNHIVVTTVTLKPYFAGSRQCNLVPLPKGKLLVLKIEVTAEVMYLMTSSFRLHWLQKEVLLCMKRLSFITSVNILPIGLN